MVKKMVTASVANKILKTLEEERNYWLHVERTDSVYTVGQGEEAIKPDYSYYEVAENIEKADKKIMNLKHAIQVHHTISEIQVDEETMSADMLQCRIDQISNRKSILGKMRKLSPVSRVNNKDKRIPSEIMYINFDQTEICEEYDRISEKLMNMQTEYELFMQTALFEIEVEM